MNSHWNVTRRQAQGERFLRMAAAADVAAARALWKDPSTPVHRRCLAARAIGLLGKHGPSWLAEGVDDDDSPLGRVRRHGTSDAERRRAAESRTREQEEAAQKTQQLGASSLSNVIGILQDQSENAERRVEAAAILRGLRCRDAVEPLIEVLAEGQQALSWMCMSALHDNRQSARCASTDPDRWGQPPIAGQTGGHLHPLAPKGIASRISIHPSVICSGHRRRVHTGHGNRGSRQHQAAAPDAESPFGAAVRSLCLSSICCSVRGWARRFPDTFLPSRRDNRQACGSRQSG